MVWNNGFAQECSWVSCLPTIPPCAISVTAWCSLNQTPGTSLNPYTHSQRGTSKDPDALLLTLLKLTVLFQAVPACSIKVYSPRTAFKDKGGSAMHSCRGGGRHSHERLHMEIFRWDNAFTRYTNNLLAACVHVCAGAIDERFQPSDSLQSWTPPVGEGDGSVMILSDEMQIFLWWSTLCDFIVLLLPHTYNSV